MVFSPFPKNRVLFFCFRLFVSCACACSSRGHINCIRITFTLTCNLHTILHMKHQPMADAVPSQPSYTPAKPVMLRHHSLQLKSTEKSAPAPPSLPPAESVSVPSTPGPGCEDSNDASQPPVSLTPRQSGSMVMHHDDVVTRMKNIEMIELGKHRIKPWYFAPYPQVCAHRFLLCFVASQ